MKKQRKTPLYGAHMSISGGFNNAIKDGESIGCTAIQIFTKSNRQWYAKKINVHDAISFQETYYKSSIEIVLAHASYLINLGACNKTILNKSINALTEELLRCDILGIPYLILHPGSSKETNKKDTITQIGTTIQNIIKNIPTIKTVLLLENSAGQGTHIGSSFEELADIINMVNLPEKIGTCFDTCHAFSAGYDFRTIDQYNHMIEQFDLIIGLKNLKAIHINDSKRGLASNVDRHEEIGKGSIGLTTFSFIMNDKRFIDIPKILETPIETLTDHARNLQSLLNLVTNQ